MPDWFKNLPQKAFSALLQEEQFTVKKCPPFVDAMTYGFLMPLICRSQGRERRVRVGPEVPGGAFASYPRSPIDFHDRNQVAGRPAFDDDRFIIKFNNFWTIELPPGYSLFIRIRSTGPIYRYVTLTGLVDADRFSDNFIHFPARWRDPRIQRRSRRARRSRQCLPVKRENSVSATAPITGEASEQLATAGLMAGTVSYRRRFRAQAINPREIAHGLCSVYACCTYTGEARPP